MSFPQRWGGPAWWPRRLDHGSASIEMVILLPALFALMFVGMQAALVAQGRAVVLAAAQEGVRATAAEAGTAAGGVRIAQAFVTASSAGLSGVTATARRSGTTVTVTVTAQVLSVIPGWVPIVTQSASMPVERVTG
ncbi:MAG: TadE family protein [Propionibacteriaceae bacterium]